MGAILKMTNRTDSKDNFKSRIKDPQSYNQFFPSINNLIWFETIATKVAVGKLMAVSYHLLQKFMLINPGSPKGYYQIISFFKKVTCFINSNIDVLHANVLVVIAKLAMIHKVMPQSVPFNKIVLAYIGQIYY